MNAVSKRLRVLCLCVLLGGLAFGGSVYAGEPLKVFILAGQSNMEGHGKMSPASTPGTLSYMFNSNPTQFAHLKEGGNWAVRDDVWIWYKRLNATTAVSGGLSAGYGAYSDNTAIGPEMQFGHVIGDFYDGPVLLIKTAWGGKSLYVDFRPPSSGWPEPPTAAGDMGYYYQEMMNTVNDFKASPESYYPDYNVADGYEIAGFVWHQGWNDRVNDVFSAAYEANMETFIKDVRVDMGVPNLPFSIATTGMDGGSPSTVIEFAQLAMDDYDKYPEFIGNTAVDDTRKYWRTVAQSPGNAGYHWNLNAETYYRIGNGLGEAMKDLLVDTDAPVIDAGVDMITWSGEPVVMAPDIVERAGSDWGDLTYTWTAKPNTGVTISNDAIKNPTVTITKPTGDLLTVALVLEVNHFGRAAPGIKNAIKIDVYDTACKAAIGKGLAAGQPSDLDGNCVTDLADFAKFASEWLYGEALTGAIRK